MSHIVTIVVEVRFDAVKSVCHRLELEGPVFGKAELLDRDVEDVLVNLPDWIFPIVCDLPTGKIHYDNFNNKWGDQKHLDKFVQTYCVEKVTLESRRKRDSVYVATTLWRQRQTHHQHGSHRDVAGVGKDM